MRITRSILTALGGLALAGFSTAATAGGACNSSGTACNPGMVYGLSAPYVTQPVMTNYHQPYSHLDSVVYRQTPVVNITRVQTGAQLAALNAAPTSGWAGCQSGTVCRQPAPVMRAPAPRPVVMAPAPRPVMVSAPAPRADLTPRQYGDASFVPGIAHIPTSVVDRSPVTRDAVLRQNGHALVGTPNMSQPSYASTSSYSASSSYGSAYAASGHSVPGMQADGTYWEKASGPTFIDGMLATEILCKKQAAPAPVMVQQQYQVVRPVIGVPTPVPTPVYCNAPAPRHAMSASRYGKKGLSQKLGYGQPVRDSRYGNTWH